MIEFPLKDQVISKYEDLGTFITRNGFLELGSGDPCRASHSSLLALQTDTSRQDEAAQCCVSALWLFQDFLDESHTLSQSIPSSEGSYLHGIMHRREGDYSNAKYWFRRSGDLPFFGSLAKQIQDDSLILPNLKLELQDFDPIRLTDLVSSAKNREIDCLKRVTFLELLAVFEHCYQRIQK